MVLNLIDKIKIRLHKSLVEPFLDYTYQTTIPANDKGEFVSKKCFPEYIQKGIKFESIYKHQKDSWDYLNSNEHLCIALSTAAGKSLCYIPYAIKIAKEGYKVIVISPLKALQLDQYNTVKEFIKSSELDKKISLSLNNSDTKKSERVYNSSITFIGEYSLDHAIKNDDIDWGKLRLIVIDEAHSYISLKGGHLANIIKRIQIKCLTYKNPNLQMVAMSATIANPVHLFERLTSYTPRLIDKNTAQIGKKNVILTKFPLSVDFIFDIFKDEGKTLIFVDNIISTQKMSLRGNDLENDNKYGYFNSTLSAEKRREILNNFEDDNHPLSILVSTSALEAGIDVANVKNVVIIVPEGGLSQISIQQRLGRCGRGFNSDGVLNEGNVLILLPETSPDPKDVWERPLEYGLPSTSEMLRYIHFTRAIYESIDKRAVLFEKPEGITHYCLDTFLEWFFPDDDVEDLIYKKNYYFKLEKFNDKIYPIFINSTAPHTKMLFQPSTNIVVFEEETNKKLGTISEHIVKNYFSIGGITNFENKFYEIVFVSKQKVILRRSNTEKEIKLNYNFYVVNLYDLTNYEKPWTYHHIGEFIISKPLLKKINISRIINDSTFNDNHIAHCLVIEGDMLYSAANGILRAIDNLFMRIGAIAMYKKDEQFLFYEVEELDDTILNFYSHFSLIIQEALRLTETCNCENGCSSCIGYVRGSMMLKTEIDKEKTIKWYKTLIHNLTIHSV